MAKFYDVVGYAGDTIEEPSGSGVMVNQMVEFPYYGDITQNIRKLDSGEKVNDDISVQNSISILADQYAVEHIFAIRYIRWEGVLWTVTSVQVQRPRLVLTLGSVYNGPTP